MGKNNKNNISERKKRKKKKVQCSDDLIIKKPRKPDTWKVNVLKHARLRGLEYVGVGGKNIFNFKNI